MALAILPIVWWIIRIMPPGPRRVVFPPVRFLFGLRTNEQTAVQVPPWLLALRLLLVALLIVGAARPVWVEHNPFGETGPIIAVVDDGWAAARDWSPRQAFLKRLLDTAAREQRPVALLGTAPVSAPTVDGPARSNPTAAGTLAADAFFKTAATQRRRAAVLWPQPWPVERGNVWSMLTPERLAGATLVWLTDGLRTADDDNLADYLATAHAGVRRVIVAGLDAPAPMILRPPRREAGGLAVVVERLVRGGAEKITVVGTDSDGRVVSYTGVDFAPLATRATASIAAPAEVVGTIRRLHILGQRHVGAVFLLDDRGWSGRAGILTDAARLPIKPCWRRRIICAALSGSLAPMLSKATRRPCWRALKI